MRIFDISRTLQDAPVYPGDPVVTIEPVRQIASGDLCALSSVTAGSHAGTHADAFSHYLADGAAIDGMPLENYCGRCRVLSVPADDLVKLDDLRGRLSGAERILLHGGGNAFLCEQAAAYLAQCGVKLIATDAVSIGPQDNEESIHKILMCAGVAIVENVVLDDVEDGEYLLFAFPVKYGGCDGAPVRAVLLRSDEPEEEPKDEP